MADKVFQSECEGNNAVQSVHISNELHATYHLAALAQNAIDHKTVSKHCTERITSLLNFVNSSHHLMDSKGSQIKQEIDCVRSSDKELKGEEADLKESEPEEHASLAHWEENDSQENELFEDLIHSGDLQENETELNSEEESIRCLMCMDQFDSLNNLDQHMMLSHSGLDRLNCTDCRRCFSTAADLMRHIRDIHEVERLKCEHCDFTSKYSCKLKLHHEAVHLRLKPHSCELCGLCFAQKGHLTKHQRRAHSEHGAYKCTCCEQTFSKRNELDAHYRSEHAEEKPYSCEQCGNSFSQLSNLTKHKRHVHEQIKTFCCTECEFRCSTRSSLGLHMKAVHYREKPHECSECDRTFCMKPDLQKHIDAVHRGLKTFTCTDCNKCFSSISALQRHRNAAHTHEIKYKCIVCDKEFLWKSSLKKHMNSHR